MHRSEREVGDEHGAGARGIHERPHERDALGRPAGGADEHVDAPLDRRSHDVDRDGRGRRVDDEVGTLELGELGAGRQRRDDLEVVVVVDHVADDAAQLACAADNGHARRHGSIVGAARGAPGRTGAGLRSSACRRSAPLRSTPPTRTQLLAEYFAMRVSTFPGHTYTTVFPESVRRSSRRRASSWSSATTRATPVGCGGIRRIDDGPHGPRYEVKHLYLRPETRGRGWGRLLMADLERRAVALGASELVLDTHHTLEAAGRAVRGVRLRGDRPVQRQSERDALVRRSRLGRRRAQTG